MVDSGVVGWWGIVGDCFWWGFEWWGGGCWGVCRWEGCGCVGFDKFCWFCEG